MIAFNLVKKEFKQNALIFIIPYLILVAIIILNLRNGDWLNPNWAEIFTICLPFAMAGAYGLQAFDLEVSGQTKDFLLTKPLTINSIIWSKFFCGLAVWLPFAFIWVALIYPQSFIKPDLNNINSFWLASFIMMVLTLYAASFLTGILVKGPIKLLVAILIGGIALGWTLFAWSEFLTLIFYLQIERFQLLALIFYYLFIIFLSLLIIRITVSIIFGIFKNIEIKDNLKQVLLPVLILIILPLLIIPFNYYNRPVICSFDNLLTSIFKQSDWFIAMKGINQPSGDLFAFSDDQGRLAIGKLYEKPEVVYVSNSDGEESLNNLCWSPNGKYISFSDNHRIKIYLLKNKKTIDFIDGDISFWSHDSKEIMIGKVLESETQLSETGGEVQRQVINLRVYDLYNRVGRVIGNFTTTGFSLGWDSKNSNLLAVDISGVLKVINTSGTVEEINLFDIDEQETVFASEVFYADSTGRKLKIVVFSINRQVDKKNVRYNVRWYDFISDTKEIKLTGVLRNIAYQDVIGYSKNNTVLVRKYDNGMYKQVKLTR